MKEEIINNLAGIIEYVKQGTDFIKEQAPLYVQEIIDFRIWTSAFEVILYLSITILLIWCMVKLHKEIIKEGGDESEFAPIYFLLGLLIIVGVVLISVSIESLIQAIIAPRVYVLEKLLSLVK